MQKNEYLDLAGAIEQYLSNKQKNNARNIRKSIRRKKRKDLKWGDRLSAFFDLHFYKSRAIDIANLRNSFKEFNTGNVLYTIQKGLREDLEYIGANIPSSEFSEISTSIHFALIHSNHIIREGIEKKNENLFKALKRSRLEARSITYLRDGKVINSSLEEGLISLRNEKLAKLYATERESVVAFNTDSVAPIDLPLSEEESYLTGIEEMVRKGEMQENDITRNIKSIRENFKTRKKLEFLRNKIWKVMCALRNGDRNSIDFSKTNKMFQAIYDRCAKQISRCDSYLSQFDFSSLQEKVELVREKREQEAWVREHLEALNNVEKVTPRNPEVVEQIKKSNMLIQNAKKALRDLALADLHLHGKIGHSHQSTGDGVAVNEQLVREKINEMISIAIQTPEQRAVSYLRKEGIKVLEPTQQFNQDQVQNCNEVFGDGTYSFDVERVREIKAIIDSQRSEKATAICREYMRYRSFVQSSMSASFTEYARVVYLQENMDLSMVDKNIRDLDLVELQKQR